MTLTTAGPPGNGIYWNAVIIKYLNLLFTPEIGMNTVPHTSFNLGLTPEIGMVPPGEFGLVFSPQITMDCWYTSRSSVSFNLLFTPSLQMQAAQEASAGLTFTPSITMNASLVHRGSQLNVAVQRASTF